MFNMTGDPIAKPSKLKNGEQGKLTTRVAAQDTMDVRDLLSGIVGKGYTSFSDDDSRAHFARLSALVGRTPAQKLFDRAFIYNQLAGSRPAVPLDQKISQFYDSSVNDASIEPIIKQARAVGSGVIGGMFASPDVMNMQITNRDIVKSK